MPETLEETASAATEISDNISAPKPDFGDNPESIKGFHFNLPVFNGPLDLLLHLIKDQKIDIYDIPIIQITRQYMDYIEFMKELNLEIAGEFLVMAATLIHIKSKMLLPPDEEDKEELPDDPRAELVQRLLEYQSYRDSSLNLRKREDIWNTIFFRAETDKDAIEFEPEAMLFDANVFDLISAFKKLLQKAPAGMVEITRESLTVTDRINFILERIEKEDGVRFGELFEEGHSRTLLIVTFLALLELVKLGLVKIYQEKSFGLIWILNTQESPSQITAGEAEEIEAGHSEVLA
ncbi:MAG: segregation/condensation protein A [Nitrospirota bacterium]|nr:segregation/condensation protein A [Nitrospirota bacterium]